MDAHHFENISKVSKLKESLDILEKYLDGGEKVKKMKLQSLKGKYELAQMEDNQKILITFLN